MNSSTVWLEIDKTNKAILSYFLERPTAASDKVEYVQATQDELTFLSALEDAVFPAGMVATISDLEAHRSRVQAAKKAKAAVPIGAASKGSQQPVNSASKPNPQTNNQSTKERFIAALKQHRSNK
ncbi:hypothetical protein MO767_21435 [Pseudomonas sp. UYIF39]|uniref:hypothetical protein n=1 Tax=Pseudomonas sp. UYIF39 TaxID=1630747 RepID=UPI00249E18DD|nr:hypothetical protein [Pseudomonas sp. UYIF39]MDI3356888.1 hypothetical protein [Pseudomonas sp. UYIF39]